LPLVYRSGALEDVADAYAWYEEQQTGLGEEFLNELLALEDRVIEAPSARPKVHEAVRRCLMRRFPYGLYYRVLDDRIEVLAVYHGRRDPRTLRRRL
jgi:plasmid stabilization system protein ParE